MIIPVVEPKLYNHFILFDGSKTLGTFIELFIGLFHNFSTNNLDLQKE